MRVVSLVNDLTVSHPFKVSVQLIRLITERAGHRVVEFGAIKVLCEWADTSRRHGRVEPNAATKARVVVLNREIDVIHYAKKLTGYKTNLRSPRELNISSG